LFILHDKQGNQGNDLFMSYHVVSGSAKASVMADKTIWLPKQQWLIKQYGCQSNRLAKQDCHDPDAEIY
jgi:hypothetical protein